MSDEAAGRAIPKLRREIGRLAFGNPGEGKDSLGKLLSWEELIHTTYFDAPSVRKLIAYLIAGSDGFRATKEFAVDPDFQRTATWYGAL